MECHDNQLRITQNLLTSGTTVTNLQKSCINVEDTYKYTTIFNDFFNCSNFFRNPNKDGSPTAITQYLKDERLLRLLCKHLENNFEVNARPYNIDLLIREIQVVFKLIPVNPLNLLGQLRAFVDDIEVKMIGITRAGFSLLTNAYNEALDRQSIVAENLAIGNLILKPCSTVGANTILSIDYLNAMHNIHFTDSDPDEIIEYIKYTSPATFGIYNVMTEKQKLIDSNGFLSTYGTNSSVANLVGLNSIRSELVKSINIFFNGLIAVQPIKNLVGDYLTDEELLDLDPERSLLEQDWIASVKKIDSSHLQTLISNFSKNSKILEFYKIDASATDKHAQVLNRLTGHDHQLPSSLIMLCGKKDLEHLHAHSYTGRIIHLNRHVTLINTLTKIWKRGSELVTKYPGFLEVAFSGLGKIANVINDKYKILPPKLIEFIKEGPGVLHDVSKDNNWSHNAKQIVMNVLPAVTSYIDNFDSKRFSIDEQTTLVDRFLMTDLKYFTNIHQNVTIPKKSKFRLQHL